MRRQHALIAALALTLAAPAFAGAPEKSGERRQMNAQRSARPESRPAAQPAPRPSARPAPAAAPRPAARPAPRREAAPAARPPQRPAARPPVRSAPPARPAARPDAAPGVRPSGRPVARPDARPSSPRTIRPDRPSGTRRFTNPAPRPTVRPDAPATRPETTRPPVRPATRPDARPATDRGRSSDVIRIESIPRDDRARPGARPGTDRPGARPGAGGPGDGRTGTLRPPRRADAPVTATRPGVTPDRAQQKQRLSERRQRLGERPAIPGHNRPDEPGARDGRSGDRGPRTGGDGRGRSGHGEPGHRDDHDGRRGHHDDRRDDHHHQHDHHHYYYDTHHHYYSHGYCHRFSHYGLGLWISFRASPFYYCPTYRDVTYVYVSPRYTTHRYYGLSTTGTTADLAVRALESGWSLLEEGRFTSARSAFARAASYERAWGLPKIGYAIALGASHNDSAAYHFMRTAFEEDPYAALELPYSPELDGVLLLLEDRYLARAHARLDERNAWFMIAAVRLMLGDAEGAADAAFASEAAGGSSLALDGLFDVLAGSALAE